MNKIKTFFPYLVVILLSLAISLPIFSNGLFPIHDDTQISRVFEMSKALEDGMFPVRWSMNLGFGFGYPMFNYYAPLAYYIAGILTFLGTNIVYATKFVMILAIMLSGLSLYIFSKDFFGRLGGLVASSLYLLAPYHAVDIYVRGDLAEYLAYGFIPLIFYGLHKIHEGKASGTYIASVAIAGVIISHNLTAFMIAPFVVFYSILLIYRNAGNTIGYLKSFTLALLLSAFYWIPTLLEMNYTNVLSQVGGGADYKDHFVCLPQLWQSSWGFGGSIKGCVDGLSFMIGKTHIVIFLLSLCSAIFLLFTKRNSLQRVEKEKIYALIVFTVFSAVAVLLSLDIAKPVWDLIKPMAIFQYPWRFLIVINLGVSFVGGFIIWVLERYFKEKKALVPTVFLIIAIVFLNYKFFTPQSLSDKPISDYTSQHSLKWTISNITSEYMPQKFSKPKRDTEVANIDSLNSKSFKVSSHSQSTKQLNIEAFSLTDQIITVPLAYFPAWRAFVDKKEVNVMESSKGSAIRISKGNHRIEFRFVQTTIEKASNVLSLIGILALIVGIIYPRFKYGKAR